MRITQAKIVTAWQDQPDLWNFEPSDFHLFHSLQLSLNKNKSINLNPLKDCKKHLEQL